MGHNLNLKICIAKEITTKWKGSLLNGRRYLQIICLISNLYSKYIKKCQSLSHVWLFVTPCTHITQQKDNVIKKWTEELNRHIFYRRHTDGQEAHEKMFNITNHQEMQIKTTTSAHARMLHHLVVSDSLRPHGL